MANTLKDLEKHLEVPDAVIGEVFKEYTDRFAKFKNEFSVLQNTVVKKGFEKAIKELGYKGEILSAEESKKIVGLNLFPFSTCLIKPLRTSKFLIKVEGNFADEKIVVTIDDDGMTKDKKDYKIEAFTSEILKQQILNVFKCYLFF